MSVKSKVEALLFSTDRPLRVGEIAEIVEESVEEVSKALKFLTDEYKNRDSAIEIKRIGNKYVMQLREEFYEIAQKVGKKELDDDVLKTLALIAFYQPIKQSKLREIVGPKAYEHVEILKSKKFVYSRRVGKTVELRTTKYFEEYFGVDSRNLDEMKKKFSDFMKREGDKDGESESSSNR